MDENNDIDETINTDENDKVEDTVNTDENNNTGETTNTEATANTDENNKIDDEVKEPKKSKKGVIIIACLIIGLLVGCVYAFNNYGAIDNTIKQIKKSSKEAVNADVVDYLSEKEINDFNLSFASPLVALDTNLHVNLGEETFKMETSLNEAYISLLLNNEVGVLNLGSESNYGFNAQTFGQDLNKALIAMGQEPIESIDNLTLAYDKNDFINDSSYSEKYEIYKEYQSGLTDEFLNSLDKEKIKGKQLVEKDGVSFQAKATKYVASPEAIQKFATESIHAYFLFLDSVSNGSTKSADTIDYANDEISNHDWDYFYRKLVDGYNEVETTANITLYEYDNIIVKTQIDYSTKTLSNNEVVEVSTNMYILDTKNVLNNMQFEYVSEHGIAGLKISSLKSDAEGEENVVGLDFKTTEDDEVIENFGYTIDTTPNKKQNTTLYYNYGDEQLKLPCTYNIIDDEFVLGSSYLGLIDFNFSLSQKELDQTMTDASEQLFDVELNELIAKEPKAFDAIESLLVMFQLLN